MSQNENRKNKDLPLPDRSRNPWQAWKALNGVVRETIKRLREGTSPKGLEREIEAIHSAIFNVAFAILQKRGVRNTALVADEMASQCCEMLLRGSFRKCDVSRDCGPYVLRGLTNLINNDGRTSIRRRRTSLIGDAVDTKQSPDKLADVKETRHTMRRHVARLPKHLRRVIILKYWFGLRAREGANRCGISEALFNQWTFKARKILRGNYGEGWQEAA